MKGIQEVLSNFVLELKTNGFDGRNIGIVLPTVDFQRLKLEMASRHRNKDSQDMIARVDAVTLFVSCTNWPLYCYDVDKYEIREADE